MSDKNSRLNQTIIGSATTVAAALAVSAAAASCDVDAYAAEYSSLRVSEGDYIASLQINPVQSEFGVLRTGAITDNANNEVITYQLSPRTDAHHENAVLTGIGTGTVTGNQFFVALTPIETHDPSTGEPIASYLFSVKDITDADSTRDGTRELGIILPQEGPINNVMTFLNGSFSGSTACPINGYAQFAEVVFNDVPESPVMTASAEPQTVIDDAGTTESEIAIGPIDLAVVETPGVDALVESLRPPEGRNDTIGDDFQVATVSCNIADGFMHVQTGDLSLGDPRGHGLGNSDIAINLDSYQSRPVAVENRVTGDFLMATVTPGGEEFGFIGRGTSSDLDVQVGQTSEGAVVMFMAAVEDRNGLSLYFDADNVSEVRVNHTSYGNSSDEIIICEGDPGIFALGPQGTQELSSLITEEQLLPLQLTGG